MYQFFPFIHESEHLNNVENNQNAGRWKLWSQVKKNAVLLPPIAKYPRTSIVKHTSYKINGIELLQTEEVWLDIPLAVIC
jgi:hypothetical protein